MNRARTATSKISRPKGKPAHQRSYRLEARLLDSGNVAHRRLNFPMGGGLFSMPPFSQGWVCFEGRGLAGGWLGFPEVWDPREDLVVIGRDGP